VFIDWKAYLAALVSVFLSLALGIVIGGTVIGADIATDGGRALIERLEADFEKLREENRALEGRLKHLNEVVEMERRFSLKALDYVVSGRLEGAAVAVVAPEDHPLLDRIARVLDAAGVGSLTEVTLKPAWFGATTVGEGSDGAADAGGRQSARGGADATDASDEARDAATLLARALTGSEPDGLHRLREDGLVEAGNAPRAPVDGAVILQGEPPDAFLLIAAALAGEGARVVVAGRVDDAVPASSGQPEAVSTVSHVDTPAGLASVVYALAGAWGHYGPDGPEELYMPEVLEAGAGRGLE